MEDDKSYAYYTTTNILRNLYSNPNYTYLSKKKNLAVLDIGCGLPLNLISLYHDFNFDTLIGLDIDSEKYIVQKWFEAHPINNLNNLVFSTNFYEFYLNNMQPKNSDNPLRTHTLTQNDFYKIINVIHHMPANYYFLHLEKDKMFDYVILENIIHLLDYNDQKLLFNQIGEHISEGGLIHIYVHHSENQVLDQYPMDETRLNELLANKFKEIYQKIYYMENTKKKKAILYVGQFVS